MGGYRSHVVAMERAGTTTTVELVVCPNWPHQSVPVSNCVHLVDCVNKKIPTGNIFFYFTRISIVIRVVNTVLFACKVQSQLRYVKNVTRMYRGANILDFNLDEIFVVLFCLFSLKQIQLIVFIKVIGSWGVIDLYIF
jgi:hypothetical protein